MSESVSELMSKSLAYAPSPCPKSVVFFAKLQMNLITATSVNADDLKMLHVCNN